MHYVQMPELETERLRLRKVRMEDICEYYERLWGDGDVCRYLLSEPHQDIGESLASIERHLQRYEEGNYYYWGAALKEDDSLIGIVALLRFDETDNRCSFAYMLGCNYWNQGYGTEMLKAAIQFAFDKLGVQKIVADHMAPNIASGKVMRKVGMKHIGTEAGKYEKLGIQYDAEVYEIRRKELGINEYQSLAMQTLNPALNKKDILINGVMGLCGESGEAIDIVKKWLAQGHALDKEKLAKELGDIAWYLAETAHALDLPLETIFQANIDKLKARYPEGFDTRRSQNRAETKD